MRIERLPSGSYRIRKSYKGTIYTVTTDYKPTQKEAMILITEKMNIEKMENSVGNTFQKCGENYLAMKSNILSATTIKGYTSLLKSGISKEFRELNLYDISQMDVQKEVNRYAEKHSPKTTRNLHGFISAVLGTYRPNMVLSTTLPQKIKYEPYIPTKKEIKKILDASVGTDFHIPFQLGVLGLRRSEVCALTLSDIEGNILTISKAKVYDVNNNWIIQKRTKTTEGYRKIYIPDNLIKEIQESGKICDMHPNTLLTGLNRYQKRLGIQQFRLHDMRHFYASYAHEQGMSDADIMASGGWKSDYTMKRVYRHSMEEEKNKAQKKIANTLIP